MKKPSPKEIREIEDRAQSTINFYFGVALFVWIVGCLCYIYR